MQGGSAHTETLPGEQRERGTPPSRPTPVTSSLMTGSSGELAPCPLELGGRRSRCSVHPAGLGEPPRGAGLAQERASSVAGQGSPPARGEGRSGRAHFPATRAPQGANAPTVGGVAVLKNWGAGEGCSPWVHLQGVTGTPRSTGSRCPVHPRKSPACSEAARQDTPPCAVSRLPGTWPHKAHTPGWGAGRQGAPRHTPPPTPRGLGWGGVKNQNIDNEKKLQTG